MPNNTPKKKKPKAKKAQVQKTKKLKTTTAIPEPELDNTQTYIIKTKKKKVKKEKKERKEKKVKKPSKHPKLKRTIKIMVILLFLFAIIGAGVAFGWAYQIFKDAKLGMELLHIKYENSIVKDINGETIAVLNGDENREIVSLNEMPEYLPIAFVSIEDERFDEHFGIDIKRTAGATVTYILGGGSSSYGGSTITQQLVKNLTNEKDSTIERKVTEMARAYHLEQELSKDQILELYLNLIFMGGTSYGVEVGSMYYFNKSCSELDLAECAFLAGINDSPNAYNPFKEDNEATLEKIKARTKTVLNKMNELGKIKSKEEYNAAIEKVNNGLVFEKGRIVENVYSYHTDAALLQIIDELMLQNDWTYDAAKLYLFSSGFTIYTTQDPNIQSIMEEEYKDPKYQVPSKKEEGVNSQSGMALIDHKTGYVLGACGKLGEKTDSFGLNRATQIKKQTGSSMKPLAVLAPGIDLGIITAASGFDDVQTSFGGRTFKNFGNSYRGLITLREAIAYSENMPMLKAMVQIGPENSMKFIESIGIELVEEDNNISLALGGLTYGTSPLKMAAAYAAIANGGEYISPTFYTKVVDSNGDTVLEVNQERRTVMSKAAAYVVTEMLTETVRSGTNTYIKVSGMSVAAKTGTTNNEFDRWFCGFTPYYTAATWYGYDKNEEVRWPGYNPASLIWLAIMQKAHEGLEGRNFASTKPDGVVQAAVCGVSGLLPGEFCAHDPRGSKVYSEYFVKGTVPSKTCESHVQVEICDDTGLLKAEFCPRTTAKVYITRPDAETNKAWTKAADSQYMLTITGTCTAHATAPNTKPVITLSGSATMNLKVKEVYNEPGAAAYDEYDGDLTGSIKISGKVDTDKAGTYTVTYAVTNSSGNEVSVTRTVIVSAVKPTIELLGSSTVTITVGDPLNEYTPPAKGDCKVTSSDGKTSNDIVITGTVDINTVGTYTIKYSITDSGGTAEVTKTITVNP